MITTNFSCSSGQRVWKTGWQTELNIIPMNLTSFWFSLTNDRSNHCLTVMQSNWAVTDTWLQFHVFYFFRFFFIHVHSTCIWIHTVYTFYVPPLSFSLTCALSLGFLCNGLTNVNEQHTVSISTWLWTVHRCIQSNNHIHIKVHTKSYIQTSGDR